MAKKFRVSQSKIKTYLRCRRQYYNKYVLGLRRKRVKRPLMFGRMVHEMLEVHANGGDPFKHLEDIGLENMQLFSAEREEYGDIVDDCRLIMADYFDHYKRDRVRFKKVAGRKAEYPFELDLTPDILWEGKIDGFVTKPDSKFVFMAEHKTFKKNKPNEDERWRNFQSTTYIEASGQMGWPVPQGVMWDYIKSAPPARPGILQNGTTSTNKNLNSLPSVVIEALKENGDDLKQYQGLIESMTVNRAKWFDREFRTVRPTLIESIMEDFTSIAQEAMDNHGKVKHRTIDRHCSWCDFEPLCRAEMEGGDVDYITQKEYYVQEDTDKKEGAVASREKSKGHSTNKELGAIRTRRNRKDDVERILPKASAAARRKRRRD